jgi:hypothetical protein
VVGVAGFVLGGLEAGDLCAESFFGDGAAAETPGVADEFGGSDFFDGVGGGEGGPEGGAEVVVFFFLFGLDAVVSGEEAEFGVIAGGFCFAFGGLGAGGEFGVFAIGVDLRFGGHDFEFLSLGAVRRSGVRKRKGWQGGRPFGKEQSPLFLVRK